MSNKEFGIEFTDRYKRVYQQANNQLLFPGTQLICICMAKAPLALLSVFNNLRCGKVVQRPWKAKLARR